MKANRLIAINEIKSIICIFAFMSFFSCHPAPKDVRLILNAAGDNRSELEKVIAHYQSSGEKEKLKAAYFLIGNMDNKAAWDEKTLVRYDPVFIFFKSLRERNMPGANNSLLVKNTWDSLILLRRDRT